MHYILRVLDWSMRGRFDSELVSVSQWFNGRTPVCKTGDLRFKSRLRQQIFISIFIIYPINFCTKLIYNCNLKLVSLLNMKVNSTKYPLVWLLSLELWMRALHSESWIQHNHLRNWDICHTVGPPFVSCVAELWCLGIKPLWHSSPSLCHSEYSDADRTGISWGVIKDGNHWAWGPYYRVDDH